MVNKIKLDYMCSSETIKIGKFKYFDIKNEIEKINYFSSWNIQTWVSIWGYK